VNAASWSIEDGPATYHDSPSGEPIETGYVWTIARPGDVRRIRIEAEPGAICNDIILAAVLRNQLAEDQPSERVLILASGELRFSSRASMRT
jgi:hypothetical protein